MDLEQYQPPEMHFLKLSSGVVLGQTRIIQMMECPDYVRTALEQAVADLSDMTGMKITLENADDNPASFGELVWFRVENPKNYGEQTGQGLELPAKQTDA